MLRIKRNTLTNHSIFMPLFIQFKKKLAIYLKQVYT